MSSENLLRITQFYSIHEDPSIFILEDRTKRGLEVRERYFDTKYGAECESGIIYDGRGTGHKVAIRWFFPKSIFILDQVVGFAEEINKRYLAIREMTCPDY